MNDDRFIRIKEVCEKTSLSKSKIYAMISAGDFPKQERRSHRVAVWRLSEVLAWMGVDQDEELLV